MVNRFHAQHRLRLRDTRGQIQLAVRGSLVFHAVPAHQQTRHPPCLDRVFETSSCALRSARFDQLGQHFWPQEVLVVQDADV